MTKFVAICFFSLCPGAYSHAHLSKPRPRNRLRCNGDYYCESHVGTQEVTGLPQPVYRLNLAGIHPGVGRIREPVCAAGLHDGRLNGLQNPGPIEATFTAGQVIDVTIDISANHGGHYGFRLCTDQSGTEDCFQRHILKFEDGTTWKRMVHDSRGGSNHLTDRVRLPANVGCDKCILSWRWDSGEKPWEGGGDESAMFVNCVDVRITGGEQSESSPADDSGNKVTYFADGVGGWGGSCTCPDGQVYQVGDNNDACGSLACIGGTSGTCNQREGEWSNKKVECAPEETTATTTAAPATTTPATEEQAITTRPASDGQASTTDGLLVKSGSGRMAQTTWTNAAVALAMLYATSAYMRA